MEVRKVTKEDREIVRDLLENHIDLSGENPADLPHLQKLLRDDRSYLFVVLIEGKVAGYALAYRFPSLYASENMAYLYDIDVVPEQREKGVGRLLMETVFKHLKADDVNELWLGTAIDNVPAQRLFAATGGIQSGETFYDYTFELK